MYDDKVWMYSLKTSLTKKTKTKDENKPTSKMQNRITLTRTFFFYERRITIWLPNIKYGTSQ